MSTGAAYPVSDFPTTNLKVTDLRRTESLETLPDISATTLEKDKRELSAWYKARNTPNGCTETQKSFPLSNPTSSDERDVSSAPSNPRISVAHRHASLSPASSLTSLESDVETESSLTSLDSDVDDDSHISRTSAGRGAPENISQATSTSLSRAARKRKRSGYQPVRHSKRLRAKRRKVASS